MSLLQVLEHRECLGAPVLGCNMPRDEHKGHQFSAPEGTTEVESGVMLQSFPRRLGVFNALPKAVGKIAPFIGRLLMRKLDCAVNRARLFSTVVISVLPLQLGLRGLSSLDAAQVWKKIGKPDTAHRLCETVLKV